MPTVHLAKILRDLGTNSVKEMFRRTGSPEKSVFRQAQIAAIDHFYTINRGYRGPFGFPLAEVEFNGNTATRNYSGGQIHFLDNTPQGDNLTVVRVRFLGFHCDAESSSDQLSGSDEPFFIIGVTAANGSKTKRYGPYEDINSGTVRSEADLIVSPDDKITPPIVLGIVAMEHDEGSPQESEEKMRKIVEEIEKKFDQAVGSFTGINTDNHVLPEWARDIVVGWVPEGAAALFGLADDTVGSVARVFFDNKADLKEWRAPAIKGMHMGNEYNVDIQVDGGDQGKYTLFFKLDLFKLITIIQESE